MLMRAHYATICQRKPTWWLTEHNESAWPPKADVPTGLADFAFGPGGDMAPSMLAVRTIAYSIKRPADGAITPAIQEERAAL